MKTIRKIIYCVYIFIWFLLIDILPSIINTKISTFLVVFNGLVVGGLCFEYLYRRVEVKKDLLKQCLGINTLISIFIISAFLSDVTQKIYIYNIICLFTTILSVEVLLLFLVLRKVEWKRYFQEKSEEFKSGIYAILFLATILRVLILNVYQRWDAAEYYRGVVEGCEKFSFNLGSLYNYRFSGHSTIGYGLISSIGEFWFPREYIGVGIVNIILSVFVTYYVYKILKITNIANGRFAAFGAFLVSCSPIFLGTSSYYNMDFGIAIFTVYVIFFWLSKQYLYMFFWSIILLFTKETGVVLLVGIFLSIIMYRFLSNKLPIGKRVKYAVKCKEVVVLLISFILVIGYNLFLKIQDLLVWDVTTEPDIVESGPLQGYFSIDIEFMIYKIKQMLFMNFNWLLVLGILIFLFVCIYKKTKNVWVNIIVFFGAFSGIILFNMIYINYTIPRYQIVYELLLCIYFVMLLFMVNMKKFITYIVLFGTTTLLLVQSVVTIDILSLKISPSLTTGKLDMVFYSNGETYMGDYLVYNSQYVYMDYCFDMILEKVEYDENMTVLILGDDVAAMGYEGYAIELNWDTKKKMRVMYSNEDTIELDLVYGVESLIEEQNKKVVVIFTPHYNVDEEYELNQLGNQFEIIEQGAVSLDVRGTENYYLLEISN